MDKSKTKQFTYDKLHFLSKHHENISLFITAKKISIMLQH